MLNLFFRPYALGFRVGPRGVAGEFCTRGYSPDLPPPPKSLSSAPLSPTSSSRKSLASPRATSNVRIEGARAVVEDATHAFGRGHPRLRHDRDFAGVDAMRHRRSGGTARLDGEPGDAAS